MTATITPAYGRDYKNKKNLEIDFNNNMDFILNDFSSPYSGKACNKTDLKNAGIKQVKARYNKQTRVFILDIK